MTPHTIKLLYYAAALLESVGGVLVIVELAMGQLRARRFVRGQPYWGPRFGGSAAEKLMPNRMRQQRERQARGVVHDQARLTKEVLAILSDRLYWRMVGPVLLIAGIVIGTVANIGSTP